MSSSKITRFLLAFVVVLLLSVGGCASASRASKSMDLASIEKIQLGKMTAVELRAQFGAPQKIFTFSKNEDIWSYEVQEGASVVQKASFVLDRESGILLTATWIPTGHDPLESKKNALAHFKNASFRVKEVGQTARHEWTNEVIYFDSRSAVSIRVNQTTGSVVAVAFGGNPSASP